MGPDEPIRFLTSTRFKQSKLRLRKLPNEFKFRKKGVNANLIVDSIKNCRKVEKDKVTFEGFEIEKWRSILKSSLTYSEKINNHHVEQSINQALYSHKLSVNFEPSDLEKALSKAYGNIRKRKPKDFLSLFRMLPQLDIGFISRSINESKIHAAENYKSGVLASAIEARDAHEEEFRHLVGNPNITGFIDIVVESDGIDEIESHNKSMNAFDEFRGILNLCNNRYQSGRMSSGQRYAVNSMISGPYSTVHYKDGKIASPVIWYEENWRRPRHVHITENRRKLAARDSLILLRSRKHNLMLDFASKAIISYCRALDIADWTSSFLNLWVVLEYLTGIESANYDLLVSRTEFIFQDHLTARETLRHLRRRRNEIVHDGAHGENLEVILYQLKCFVEALLWIIYRNKLKFEAPGDFFEFLDIAKNQETREKQIRLLKLATKFRQ